MAVNFQHTTDITKSSTFYVKKSNVEFTQGSNTNNIVTKLFNSFMHNYHAEEQILRNGSNYSFESVYLLVICFHNIDLRRGTSHIAAYNWKQNKKATINPQNFNNNECFRYAMIAALHHQDISYHPERITKLEPYVNNYNWNKINFAAGRNDWEIFQRNNKDVALNILYAPSNDKRISLIYKSDHNRKRKNQVNLLLITDKNKEDTSCEWHYLALKGISCLFRGRTSNHNGGFYCLNCLHSYQADSALKKHERLRNGHKYCEIVKPSLGKNILKYNSGKK